MRRIYFLVPLLGLAAFASYYANWRATTTPTELCKCFRGSPWWPCEHSDGARDAEAALRRGHFVLLSYGYPSPSFWDYQTVMQTDYGVTIRTVAGCVVDDHMVRYVEAYNAVMAPEIERRFGRAVFTTAHAKAEARYAAQSASKPTP